MDLAAYHQKKWPASGNEYESQTTTDSTHENVLHTQAELLQGRYLTSGDEYGGQHLQSDSQHLHLWHISYLPVTLFNLLKCV